MEIIQVCPYFYPHVGGVESHVLELSREFVKRGHSVTVMTSNHGGLKTREEIFGIQVVRVKPWMTWANSPVTPGIRRELAERKADIVHGHSPPPLSSYYAAKACSRSKNPFVVTYHCDIEVPRLTGLMATAIYRRTFEAYTLRMAHRVITTTQSYAATSRAIWKRKPVVIPNAVDITRFNPDLDCSGIKESLGLKAGEPMVLFVGRLVKHKGIEYLIDAAKRVKGGKFVIAGTGDHEGVLKEMVASRGLTQSVIFPGHLSDADLPRYYCACDLFVLPSISRLEAFGIVALEAMACGKPVVVSDIPGVREMITEGEEGLLCEPMNSEDLTKKIRYLLSHDDLRREMGTKGRRKVEDRFNIKRVGDDIEKLYDDVLSLSTSKS